MKIVKFVLPVIAAGFVASSASACTAIASSCFNRSLINFLPLFSLGSD